MERVSIRFVSVLGGKVAVPRTVKIGNDAPPDDVSKSFREEKSCTTISVFPPSP